MKDPNTERSPYNNTTAGLLRILRDTDAAQRKLLLKNMITQESDQLSVELETDSGGLKTLVITRPSDQDRTNAIILERRDELKEQGMKNGTYARYYFNRSPSQIGNIINGVKCPRDVILTGVLMMRYPLTADQTSHALMEVGHPGLFTDTYIARENLRNYVLRRLLTHINALGVPQDQICWPEFAWNMLAYLELEPLLGKEGSASCLTDAQRELIDSWWNDAKALCGKVNYMRKRKQHLNRFLEHQHISVSELAANSFINVQTFTDLFLSEVPTDGKHSSHGRRDSLICGAIALGCTLEETNTMLREANHPLLYPLRSDDNERIWISLLLQNNLDRERTARA